MEDDIDKGPVKSLKAKPSPEQVKSIDTKTTPTNHQQLWAFAYGKLSGSFSLSQTVLRDVKIADSSHEEVVETIASNYHLDDLFRVPPKILCLFARKNSGKLQSDFAIRAVAYSFHLYLDLPKNLSNLPSLVENSFTAIMESARKSARSRGLSKSAELIFASNVCRTFALLMVINQEWDLQTYVRELSRLVWESDLKRELPTVEAAILADAAATEALGIVVRVWKQTEREDLKRRQEEIETNLSLKNEIETNRTHIKTLQEDFSQIQFEATSWRAKADELRSELDAQIATEQILRAHHANDLETLRGTLLRSLKKQAEIIAEAIEAFRENHSLIAEERMNDSIRAITNDLSRIRGYGK